tara:strand:- start:48 stop:200 length:153 start_codon:yes stop_codon:yes gene_type:complete
MIFTKNELQMIEVSLYVFSLQEDMHESKQTKIFTENLLEKVGLLRRDMQC